MTARLRMRVLAVLALLVLPGCLPDTINPLGDPAAAEPDTDLLGQWVGTLDGTATKLEITAEDGGMLKFRLDPIAPGDKDQWVVLKGFPATAKGNKYVNVKFFEEKDKVYDQTRENYYILRYQVGRDGTLTAWGMAEQPVVNAIVDGFVNGAVDPSTEGRIIHITDSTVVVRQFVEISDPDRLFTVKYASFDRPRQ